MASSLSPQEHVAHITDQRVKISCSNLWKIVMKNLIVCNKVVMTNLQSFRKVVATYLGSLYQLLRKAQF